MADEPEETVDVLRAFWAGPTEPGGLGEAVLDAPLPALAHHAERRTPGRSLDTSVHAHRT